MARKTIKVDNLARVEGEGALTVTIRDGEVKSAELRIFEPPRFFEAFLRGRAFSEAPDITARICGICPVAYQMSAVHAMEDALGVTVGGQLRDAAPAALLRRMDREPRAARLHAARARFPRLRGRASRWRATTATSVKQRPRAEEGRQRADERCSAGARSTRSTSASAASTRRRASANSSPLAEALKRARDIAARDRALGRRASISPTASATTSWSRCAIRTNIRSTRGASSPTAASTSRAREYDAAFRGDPRRAFDRAAIAHARDGGTYLVGPLARYSLNFDRLSPLAQEAAREAGLGPICTNPYQSIIVRAVEVLYACDEALRIIEAYERAGRGRSSPVEPRAGIGYAATEAPRGMLYHRYRLDDDGTILEAQHRPADLAEPGEHRGGPRRPSSTTGSTCPTRRSAIAASRRCATTTRASPAPPISSTSRIDRG